MSSRSIHIANSITSAILSGRLNPGRKLGERELSEIFHASRAVVRQALIRVCEGGLVVIERNRGAFVAKPSLQECIEIYDTLTLLEQGVAQLLSRRFGMVEGIIDLRQHVEYQRKAVREGNTDFADQLGREFHTKFVRLCRNKVIQDVHEQIARRVTTLGSLCCSEFDYSRLMEEHVEIVNLLEQNKVEELIILIDTHYRNVLRGYIMDETVYPDLPLEEALSEVASHETYERNKVERDMRLISSNGRLN